MHAVDISATETDTLVQKIAAHIGAQMQAPLSEEVTKDGPFNTSGGRTIATREYFFALIDKTSYVCISGTW